MGMGLLEIFSEPSGDASDPVGYTSWVSRLVALNIDTPLADNAARKRRRCHRKDRKQHRFTALRS